MQGELPGDVLRELRRKQRFGGANYRRLFADKIGWSYTTLWRLGKITAGSDPSQWETHFSGRHLKDLEAADFLKRGGEFWRRFKDAMARQDSIRQERALAKGARPGIAAGSVIIGTEDFREAVREVVSEELDKRSPEVSEAQTGPSTSVETRVIGLILYIFEAEGLIEQRDDGSYQRSAGALQVGPDVWPTRGVELGLEVAGIEVVPPDKMNPEDELVYSVLTKALPVLREKLATSATTSSSAGDTSERAGEGTAT